MTEDNERVDTQSEQRALVEVADRLSELFPSVSREGIEQIVQEEYARFDDARVRDYVPTLTENAATDRLREVAPMKAPVVPEDSDDYRPIDVDISLDPYEVEAQSEQPGPLNGDLRNN
jgi:hypothetical protein